MKQITDVAKGNAQATAAVCAALAASRIENSRVYGALDVARTKIAFLEAEHEKSETAFKQLEDGVDDMRVQLAAATEKMLHLERTRVAADAVLEESRVLHDAALAEIVELRRRVAVDAAALSSHSAEGDAEGAARSGVAAPRRASAVGKLIAGQAAAAAAAAPSAADDDEYGAADSTAQSALLAAFAAAKRLHL